MKATSVIKEKKVCIVVPAYKKNPSENEILSLFQLKKVLPEFPKYLMIPRSFEESCYTTIDKSLYVLRFDDKYFENIKAYSSLCRKPLFYRQFLEYEYLLIYQLDCFVFRKDLSEWCDKGFDYIGPPWIEAKWMKQKLNFIKMPFLMKYLNKVGNGGLSLRNVKKFYYASFFTQFISTKIIFHEDVLWSNVVRFLYPGFRIADIASALDFGFEEEPEKCLKLNGGKLPFGCHAWEKYNPEFWKIILKNHFQE